MKLFQLPLKIFIASIWIIFFTQSVRSQSGRMSDITLPNPNEVIVEPDVDVVEPTTEQPDVDVAEPSAEQPDVDVVEPTAEQPEVDVVEPSAEQPEVDAVEPTTEQPDVDVVEPTAEQPDVDVVEPTAEQPDVVEPTAEQPEVDVVEPTAEQPDVIEPTTEQPEVDLVEPTTEQPDVIEPTTEQPDVIEPTTEQPDVDVVESVVEETDTLNNFEEETAGDTVTVEETPTDNTDSPTQDTDLEQNNTNDSGTAFKRNPTSDESPTSDVDIDSEVETIDAPTTESNSTESEIVDSEPVTTEQEDVAAEAETVEETIAVEEPTKSNEIVEELIEEAELREANRYQRNEEEAVEEIVEEQTTEEAAQKEEVVEEETAEEVIEEETAEEVVEEELASEEEEAVEEQVAESEIGQLDRVAYETQFQEAPDDLAILMQEEFQLTQLIGSSGIEIYGSVPSVKQISTRLAQLAEQTGKKPAFINISLQSNQLESFVVLPNTLQAQADSSLVASSDLNSVDSPQPQALTIRKTVKDTSREDIIATATEFRREISDIRKLNQEGYKASAQELYDVLIRPIEAELEANDIDVLVFSMDSGLRLLPVAALHDGEQFLVEKYAMGIVPSFGLTDTRYVSPEGSSILAMGASEFEEQAAALPTMPIELQTIVSNPRQGESFLNEQFTIPNFVAQNSREAPFSIIHLGTHAEFKAGDMSDSYIQFYDDKLKIPQLQQLSEELGWNSDATPIELLVLSACETALGDQEAELGFAGLAVQAGVKSALASLWYVSDLGTLALMGEFYDQLGNTLIKAEALRQTQLEMLSGNVIVDNKQVSLSNGADLPLPGDFPDGTLSLDHPYFWSAFTLIGNWN